MTIFKKNLDAFREREPELAKAVAGAKPSARIKQIVNKAGKAAIEVSGPDGKGSLVLPDIHKPVLDAMAGELASARMVVILGFGSGSLLAEVVSRASDQAFILLIEPDIDLFTAVLREVEMERILKLNRVCLSVGEKPKTATFVRAESEYGVFTIPEFSVVENRWSAPIYSSYFSDVKDQINQLKSFASQNILAFTSLGPLWKSNVLANLQAIMESGSVSSLFGKYDNVPAVVVSAGPSLDKNVFRLLEFKKHGIVIAVGAALRSLLLAGVTPDIVVSLDAKEENYFHHKGTELPNTLMALNPVVHPKIVEEHAGPKVFMDYAEPLFRWLETVIGERGTIRSGGTVASSAFDLAVKMGCSPVIFAGQDMSYVRGRTHAGNTTHETMRSAGVHEGMDDNSRLGKDLLADSYEAEDIFGRAVTTNIKMDGWRRWFEIIIESDSVTAFNATEGGLKIEGARNVSIAEVISCCPGREAIIAPAEQSGLQNEGSMETVIEALTGARDEARSVKTVCGKGMVAIKKTMAQTENAKGGLGDAKKSLADLGEISREILNQKTFAEINRWSVDSVLDKVDGLQKEGNKLDDDRAGFFVTLESFRVLFSDFYQTAADFEREASKTISRLKRILSKV